MLSGMLARLPLKMSVLRRATTRPAASSRQSSTSQPSRPSLGIGNYHPYIAIEATVQVEITTLWGYVKSLLVIANHGYGIGGAGLQEIRYFKGETVVRAAMLSHYLSSHQDGCHRAGSFELEEHPLASKVCRGLPLLGIGAIAATVAAVAHKVFCVPSMRKVYGLAGGAAAPETARAHLAGWRKVPGVVERTHFTPLGDSCCSQKKNRQQGKDQEPFHIDYSFFTKIKEFVAFPALIIRLFSLFCK